MKKKTVGPTFGILLILVAATVIFLELRPTNTSAGRRGVNFYTDDDGQTYFEDSIFKFPPFNHNGKTAVRALVYSSDGQTFVGYMQRYTPTAQKLLQDAYDHLAGGNADRVEITMNGRDMSYGGSEMKLPGANNKWMPAGKFSESMVKAPNGGQPILVAP
jgi:hypothetical protein